MRAGSRYGDDDHRWLDHVDGLAHRVCPVRARLVLPAQRLPEAGR